MTMSETLEQRVQHLEDLEAIRALKLKYCAIADAGVDPSAMVDLYTDDAIWESDSGNGRHEGREQLLRAFEGFFAATTFARHNVTNGVIDIDGDTAVGTWNFTGVVHFDGSDPLLALARYEEKYVRQDGSWKFAHVRSVSAGAVPLPGFVVD